jgi:hypothetical protein
MIPIALSLLMILPQQNVTAQRFLSELRVPYLTAWRGGNQMVSIRRIELERLIDLEMRNIWIGYDAGGWDIPDNPYPVARIVGLNEIGIHVEVWIWSAPDVDELYLFMFDSLVSSCDADGNHCGIHPSAAVAVNTAQFWLCFERERGIVNAINSS